MSLLYAVFVLLLSLDLSKYEVTDFAYRTKLAHAVDDELGILKALHGKIPLLRALRLVLLTVVVVASSSLLSWLMNPPIAMVITLTAMLIGLIFVRTKILYKGVEVLFVRVHPHALAVATILEPLLRLAKQPSSKGASLPASPEEFLDLLRRLPSTTLQPQQRQRLEVLFAAEKKSVSDVMTRRKYVVTAEPSATLGPVLLSDLQKSGHGHFPVVTKKGEPEGILTLGDVADIQQAKQRVSVRELMSSHVSWVSEDCSVQELAQLFLQEKQYIILVKNKDDEFSGMVTIADLMKHLVGIVKE